MRLLILRGYPVVVVLDFLSASLVEASLKSVLSKFLFDESGATAIEYGLIAAGISIAIIVSVNGLGSNLNTMFNSINTSLK